MRNRPARTRTCSRPPGRADDRELCAPAPRFTAGQPLVSAVGPRGAAVVAFALIEVNSRFPDGYLQNHWPRLFGAAAAGSRNMLSAIATSMITVAGVAFSITIVALSLASTQYTSRILRNFMRDHSSQTVLGSFLGIYVYCLIVLRAIREGDEGGFVPSVAVLFGFLLAVFGIGCLIFFIHHIASSIQAESIIERAAAGAIATIDRLFPDEAGEGDEEQRAMHDGPVEASTSWRAIPSPQSGYIDIVENDELLRFATVHDAVLRVERGVGEFVAEGAPLVSVNHANGNLIEQMRPGLESIFTIGHQRTSVQDAGLGIRQIVDIALKALSPGVNDTTTAVTCVHYLTAILGRLAGRRMDSSWRYVDGRLRLLARCRTFSDLLGQAFDQIRQNADGNVAVLRALLEGIESIASRTREPSRLQALFRQAEMIASLAARSVGEPRDLAGIEAALERLRDLSRS